eukprot:gnl/MRDRNA2_/MRDRNA2_113176_c0_seq1.p1 gnl/MRDRNA2_/MRDRNA2_113176_c0~~gnl/MRDRNA2_/MRDRNA2_113176_c0_seq1.p1  ORF type:complete len:209 (-),score=40.25 gnl/MRDRNA2_/MRDRNA2_113176_c0_seq1:66-692(-)
MAEAKSGTRESLGSRSRPRTQGGDSTLPPLSARSGPQTITGWSDGGFGDSNVMDDNEKIKSMLSGSGIEHAQRKTRVVREMVGKWLDNRVIAIDYHKKKTQELNVLNKKLEHAEMRYNAIMKNIQEKKDSANRLQNTIDSQMNTLLVATQGIKKMNKKLAGKGKHFRNSDKVISNVGYEMGRNAGRFSDEAAARYTKLLQYDIFPEPA